MTKVRCAVARTESNRTRGVPKKKTLLPLPRESRCAPTVAPHPPSRRLSLCLERISVFAPHTTYPLTQPSHSDDSLVDTAAMPFPYISDVDISSIRFSKMYTVDGKSRVDISQSNGKKLIFALCADCQEPYRARYPLDNVREDAQDKTRRGQKIVIGEPATKAALEALDEAVVQAAVANAADWFKSKTPVDEDTIRARYQRIVFEESPDDEDACMKFKVKTETARVPTKLHRVRNDGKICECQGRVSDLEAPGARMAPILSSFGLWFMGGKDPTKFGVSFQAEEIVVTPGEGRAPLSNFQSKRKIEAVPQSESVQDEEESKRARTVEARDYEEGNGSDAVDDDAARD